MNSEMVALRSNRPRLLPEPVSLAQELCGTQHGRQPASASEKIGGAFRHLGLLERSEIFGGVRPLRLGDCPVTASRMSGFGTRPRYPGTVGFHHCAMSSESAAAIWPVPSSITGFMVLAIQ
jgi:hypothetical protein